MVIKRSVWKNLQLFIPVYYKSDTKAFDHLLCAELLFVAQRRYRRFFYMFPLVIENSLLKNDKTSLYL